MVTLETTMKRRLGACVAAMDYVRHPRIYAYGHEAMVELVLNGITAESSDRLLRTASLLW